MQQNIYGTSAPHLKGRLSTSKIMLFTILALVPAGIHGIFTFGISAAFVILLTCASAVLTEVLFELITKKAIKAAELRVLFISLLTAYCLPPAIEWYIAVIAGVLCSLIMQLSLHFFGKNIVSPVIFTRIILMFAFEQEMTTYLYDGLTMATPLAVLKNDGTVDILSMLFGRHGGCIGETSALLLCFGAIALILLGIMDFRVSGMYLFTFAAFMAVLGGHGLSSYFLSAHLAGGGFMLALWFITPEYSTLPITKDGRLLYGMVLGLLTGIFRLFGPAAENISFAILIANVMVPILEKITIRRPFGVEKGQL